MQTVSQATGQCHTTPTFKFSIKALQLGQSEMLASNRAMATPTTSRLLQSNSPNCSNDTAVTYLVHCNRKPLSPTLRALCNPRLVFRKLISLLATIRLSTSPTLCAPCKNLKFIRVPTARGKSSKIEWLAASSASGQRTKVTKLPSQCTLARLMNKPSRVKACQLMATKSETL